MNEADTIRPKSLRQIALDVFRDIATDESADDEIRVKAACSLVETLATTREPDAIDEPGTDGAVVYDDGPKDARPIGEDDSGPQEAQCSAAEIRAELRTVIALDNGETLQTATRRDSVVSAIQTVAKDGSDFFYVDPPHFHAEDATQQVGVRASRVVSVACRYEF